MCVCAGGGGQGDEVLCVVAMVERRGARGGVAVPWRMELTGAAMIGAQRARSCV